jgi:hypothetical protein
MRRTFVRHIIEHRHTEINKAIFFHHLSFNIGIDKHLSCSRMFYVMAFESFFFFHPRVFFLFAVFALTMRSENNIRSYYSKSVNLYREWETFEPHSRRYCNMF